MKKVSFVLIALLLCIPGFLGATTVLDVDFEDAGYVLNNDIPTTPVDAGDGAAWNVIKAGTQTVKIQTGIDGTKSAVLHDATAVTADPGAKLQEVELLKEYNGGAGVAVGSYAIDMMATNAAAFVIAGQLLDGSSNLITQFNAGKNGELGFYLNTGLTQATGPVFSNSHIPNYSINEIINVQVDFDINRHLYWLTVGDGTTTARMSPIIINASVGNLKKVLMGAGQAKAVGDGAFDNLLVTSKDGDVDEPSEIPASVVAANTATTHDPEVTVSWNAIADSDGDLAGYNVYRIESDSSAATTVSTLVGSPVAVRINDTLITDTLYVDDAPVHNQPYFYYVSAVDTNGNETVLSAAASVTALAFNAVGNWWEKM